MLGLFFRCMFYQPSSLYIGLSKYTFKLAAMLMQKRMVKSRG